MQYESTKKQTQAGTWSIQLLGDDATWLLKWREPNTEWVWLHGYTSAEAAAAAVASGSTGVINWDAMPPQKDIFALKNWRVV